MIKARIFCGTVIGDKHHNDSSLCQQIQIMLKVDKKQIEELLRSDSESISRHMGLFPVKTFKHAEFQPHFYKQGQINL